MTENEMTNQAAQTMPEPVTASMCPSSDYAKGWNDCLAALSQTAGVPDGWKLVPVEATEAMQEAFNDWRPTEGNKYAGAQSVSAQDRWEFRQRYAAMLSAAPAASGVHPDALPDGTLSKSTAKRLASASVSERARALMAQAYRDGGFPYAAGTLEAGVIDSVDSCALRAIEQALTQQRGPSVADDMRAFGVGYMLDGQRVDPSRITIITTPQPSADAVRELVNRWRGYGKDCGVSQVWGKCADELESLLSGGSHA